MPTITDGLLQPDPNRLNHHDFLVDSYRPRLDPTSGRQWVWVLQGGGAKGAFQFGAMLRLAHDVRLRPSAIASTSVGSLNMIGAAEVTMAGIEKAKQTWLSVQNVHDMYQLSPWVDRVDAIPGSRRSIGRLRDLVEGSEPRTLHPNPPPTDPIDRAFRGALDAIPNGVTTAALGVGNLLSGGVIASLAAFVFADKVEDLRETLEGLRQAHEIIRTDGDGIWRFDPMRRKVTANLDLARIRSAGTKLRVCMVSLSDGLTYAVDEQLRVWQYRTPREPEARAGGTDERARLIGRLEEAQTDAGLSIRGDDALFTEAVLASASIPVTNPPIKLRRDTKSTSDLMVDGGVREVLPIHQALHLINSDLRADPRPKGVIAIGAGVVDPQRTDYLVDELRPPSEFRPQHYRLADYGAAAVGIAIEANAESEFAVVSDLLPPEIAALSITPSFLLGETTDIDPGIVQISIAYGWMTAYDKLRKVEREMTTDAYRALSLNTNAIAQRRYAAWKLEREGTTFRLEHEALFERVNGVIPISPTQGADRAKRLQAREILRQALRDVVPAGWTFKSTTTMGSSTTPFPVLPRIRQLKLEIRDLITTRVRSYGLESLPNVHDLSSFRHGNVNRFSDWFRHWERHGIVPNERWPSGPGQLGEDGVAVPFARRDQPWSGHLAYMLSESPSTVASWLRAAIRRAEEFLGAPLGVPYPPIPTDRTFGITPGQVSFAAVQAVDPGRAWFERDAGYGIVGLEGHIFAAADTSRPGTVPLRLLWNAAALDNWTTSTSVVSPSYTRAATLGYVYDPRRPQPDGTVPLLSWRSASRQDTLTSADYWRFVEGNPYAPDRWSPLEPVDPDYLRLPGKLGGGLEGFIFPSSRPAPPGTVPMYRWMSPDRQDNLTTTDPYWQPTVR